MPFVRTNSVNNGMYGYNAILAVLAVASILGNGSCTYIKARIAMLLSLLLLYAGLHMEFVSLTAPFVLSRCGWWLCIILS